MRLLLALASLLPLACSSPSPETPATTKPAAQGSATPSAKTAAPADVQIAYFAGGCFWGVEHYLEQIDGVLQVESGYMGGHVESPSYRQVASQTSGHLETVEVRFDRSKTTYEAVAKRFFEIHDPTQADGQGPDRGPEYRSAVFYVDADQKKVTEQLIATLVDRGYAVVTEVRQAEKFWRAEDYHQDYYAGNGKTPYCHSRVRRFED